VSAAEAATRVDPDSIDAWSRYAHALARTDRIAEGINACHRALELGDESEVAELLAWLKDQEPRGLSERSAA
jgi:hypothetical protein